MKANEQATKSQSTRTGRFATLAGLFGGRGIGASSRAGRRTRGSFLIAVPALLATLLVLAPSALAAKNTVATIGTEATGVAGATFSTPRGVAINRTGNGGAPAGTFYVVDSSNHRIQQFSPAGAFIRTWGWGVKDGAAEFEICSAAASCQKGINGTGAGQLNTPQRIAVDPATGNVFVSNQSSRRIDVFGPNGVYEGGFGWGARTGAAEFQFCTTLTGCSAPGTTAPSTGTVAGGQFGAAMGGLAVDSSGRVYLANGTSRRVDVFQPTLSGNIVTGASFVASFGWGTATGAAAFEVCTTAATCKAPAAAGTGVGQFATSAPTDVAVDSEGNVFALDAGNKRVQEFSPLPAPSPITATFGAAALTAAFGTGSLYGVAIDPADHVYVAGSNSANANKIAVAEANHAGAAVEVHGTDLAPTSANGLAVLPTALGGNIYVSSSIAGHRVYVLNDTKPTLEVTSPVGPHSATFNGKVVSNELEVKYHFEYSSDEGATWTKVPAADASVPAAPGEVPVSQAATGLAANTEYLVRLVATRPGGGFPLTSASAEFTTASSAPTIVEVGASSIRGTSALLAGKLNPENQATTFYFEYGPDTNYGSKTPVTNAGSGGSDVVVSYWLKGLEPGTLYHYRLRAENPTGPTDGLDATILTGADLPTDSRGVPLSPTGRAYEMVTPPFKSSRRGSASPRLDEVTSSNTAAPASDGESVLYTVLFGILADPGGANASDPYRIGRGEAGWQAEPIYNNPIQGPVENANSGTRGTVSQDQRLSVWGQNGAMSIFPEDAATFDAGGSKLNLRLIGRDPAWATPPGFTHVPGWAPIATDASQVAGPSNSVSAQFTDSGRFLLRSAEVRGLLGPDDPSLGQKPAQEGGSTVYRQDLESGAIELVSACTGTGEDATLIPNRVGTGIAADTIGTQPCVVGSLTSNRGASLGGSAGGNFASAVPLAGRSLNAASNTSSHDADRVFFSSPDPASSTNPATCAAGVDAATSCPTQVYVRSLDADGEPHVAWVSRSRSVATGEAFGGPMIDGQQIAEIGRGVAYEGASKDGSKVFFRTNAPLVPSDPNGGSSITTASASNNSWDLYEYDLPDDSENPGNGTLTRISGGPGGAADPNVVCSTVASSNCTNPIATPSARFISVDGGRVYFVTVGSIPGAVNSPPANSSVTNLAGGTAVSTTVRNLYLYDSSKSGSARWKFVASLPFSTSSTVTGGINACATSNTNAAPPISYSASAGPFIIPNGNSCVFGNQAGTHLVLMSAAKLTVDDTDAAVDIYLYDATTDVLTRVSAPDPDAGGVPYTCVTAGSVQCNADLGWSPQIGTAYGPSGGAFLNVGDDGSVLFESRVSLVSADVNGSRMDVYQWKEGQLSLVSPGDSDDDSYLSGNSVSGRDVFFATTAAIDPREVDPGDADIYDARIGGGFPPAVATTPCDVLADGCQGAASIAPASPAPASATFSGPGNPAPVKAKTHKKKHHKKKNEAGKRARHANGNRRAGK